MRFSNSGRGFRLKNFSRVISPPPPFLNSCYAPACTRTSSKISTAASRLCDEHTIQIEVLGFHPSHLAHFDEMIKKPDRIGGPGGGRKMCVFGEKGTMVLLYCSI